MKRLLPILFLLLGYQAFAQRWQIGQSEYFTIGMEVGGAHNGRVSFIQGTAIPVAGSVGAVNLSGGAHNSAYRDSSRRVHTMGIDRSFGQGGDGVIDNNAYGDTKILTDSFGNQFFADTVISSGDIGGSNMFAIDGDSLWGWGHLGSGLGGERASGNYSRPVRIHLPAGVGARYICANVAMIMLGSDSNAYIIGGGGNGFHTQYLNPQGTSNPDTAHWYKIPLPGKVRKITGGYYWSTVELYNGQMWGWGSLAGYLGLGGIGNTNSSSPSAVNVPVNLTTALNLSTPLRDLQMSSVGTYAIDKFGVGWFWGDASNGNAGNGTHLNMSLYTNGGSPAPYAWNLGVNPAQLLVGGPVVMLPGINLVRIFTSTALCFQVDLQDSLGNTYFAGRNKGGTAGDSVVDCETFGLMGSKYPNSHDDSFFVAINPRVGGTALKTTPPICIYSPSATYCNTGTVCVYNSAANPVATTNGNQTVTVGQIFYLDATHSTAAATYGIIGCHWKRISGPNGPAGDIPNPELSRSPMVHTVAGTDVYRVSVMDNQYQTNTATVTITTTTGGVTPCNCTYFFATAGSSGNTGTDSLHPKPFTDMPSLAATTDTFALHRGDTWNGSIPFVKNLRAYGSGANPNINGWTVLSGFTSLGGNIWAATCAGCSLNTNLLTIGGVPQQWAKGPYRPIAGFSGNNYLVITGLSSGPTYTGYVAIRTYHYLLTTCKITRQSGDTLFFTSPDLSSTGSIAALGYGAFIIGDTTVQDAQGEWVFSPGTGKIKIYSIVDPNTLTVKVATVDTLYSMPNGQKNVSITGVAFEGANKVGISVLKDTNVIIQNSSVHYVGGTGISVIGGVNVPITGNHIQYAQDAGIFVSTASDSSKAVRVYGDTVLNTGMLLGQSRDRHQYTSISNGSLHSIANNNYVDTVGGGGIFCFQWDSVCNNYVRQFCITTDDQGALYPQGYSPDTTRAGIVEGNTVTEGVGNIQGTTDTKPQVFGIYFDNNNTNRDCRFNSISKVNTAGIYIHNSRNSRITDNVFYDNNANIQFQEDDFTKPIVGNVLKRNIHGVTASRYAYIVANGAGHQFTGHIGTLDSNYYGYAAGQTAFFIYNAGSKVMQFGPWSDSTGETHATLLPAATLFTYNATSAGVLKTLTSSYLDAKNTPFYNSTILPAFRSLLLFDGNYITIQGGRRPRFK